jgi:hypothetical protein
MEKNNIKQKEKRKKNSGPLNFIKEWWFLFLFIFVFFDHEPIMNFLEGLITIHLTISNPVDNIFLKTFSFGQSYLVPGIKYVIYPLFFMAILFYFEKGIGKSFKYLRRRLQPRWLNEPLIRVGLNLIAGLIFAGILSMYWSYGTVKYIYDKPEVRFEKGIDENHAPQKIEYIVRIIVENKTDHPFEMKSVFNFLGVEKDKTKISNLNNLDYDSFLSLVFANKGWKSDFVGAMDSPPIISNLPNYLQDFVPLSDGYGKLKPHDYFKAKAVLEIWPPKEMSFKEFKDSLLNLPVTVGLSSGVYIKYPKEDNIGFPIKFFPYRDVILEALNDKSSFY